MIQIRNYQPTDFAQVRDILEQGGLFYEQIDNANALEKKVKQAPDTIIVAVDDGRVVGTEVIIPDLFPFLFRLAVHPDFRKRGIGKQLMQRGEEILRSKGYDHVNILEASNDLELQEYYKKHGYEKGNTYTWMYKEFK